MRAVAVLKLGALSAFASRRMTANKTCVGMEGRGNFQYILASRLYVDRQPLTQRKETHSNLLNMSVAPFSCYNYILINALIFRITCKNSSTFAIKFFCPSPRSLCWQYLCVGSYLLRTTALYIARSLRPQGSGLFCYGENCTALISSLIVSSKLTSKV